MMSMPLGVEVELTFSDPWDFVTENGAGPFLGKILQLGQSFWNKDNSAVLLKLTRPISFHDTVYEYMIASPRLESDAIEGWGQGSILGCNLIGLPPERLDPEDPFNLSWWRGGGTFIGSLKVIGPMVR